MNEKTKEERRKEAGTIKRRKKVRRKEQRMQTDRKKEKWRDRKEIIRD